MYFDNASETYYYLIHIIQKIYEDSRVPDFDKSDIYKTERFKFFKAKLVE